MRRLCMVAIIFGAAGWSQPITVNSATKLQTIQGFGASTAFLGQFSNTVMDFFYTNSGIGLSILRIMIIPDAADCPDTCVAVTTGSGTVRTVELANAQRAVLDGAIVIATSWSPPGAMKSNGAYGSGGSYLGGSVNNTALATAYAGFVSVMAANGVPVYGLSIQNEPDLSESYASCTWTAQQFHDFMPVMTSALVSAGHTGTKVMIAEPSGWNGSSYMATAMADSAVAPDVGILAAHAYNGSASSMSLASFGNVSTQQLWETEVSDFAAYDGSITSGLTYATEIHQWLTTSGVNAWLYWWMSAQGVATDNEGLTSNTGAIPKRAYAIANWAKFVKPGCSMVGVSNPTSLLISAFTCGSSPIVIVAVNNSATDVASQAFSLGGVAATQVTPWITSGTYSLQSQAPVGVSGSSFFYTIPAYSIVTLVSTNPVGSALNGGVTIAGGVLIE